MPSVAELRNLQCGGICECGGWDDDVSDDTSTAMIVANSGTSGGNLELACIPDWALTA